MWVSRPLCTSNWLWISIGTILVKLRRATCRMVRGLLMCRTRRTWAQWTSKSASTLIPSLRPTVRCSSRRFLAHLTVWCIWRTRRARSSSAPSRTSSTTSRRWTSRRGPPTPPSKSHSACNRATMRGIKRQLCAHSSPSSRHLNSRLTTIRLIEGTLNSSLIISSPSWSSWWASRVSRAAPTIRTWWQSLSRSSTLPSRWVSHFSFPKSCIFYHMCDFLDRYRALSALGEPYRKLDHFLLWYPQYLVANWADDTDGNVGWDNAIEQVTLMDSEGCCRADHTQALPEVSIWLWYSFVLLSILCSA